MAKPVSEDDAEYGRRLAEYRAAYPEAWGFVVEWDDELGLFIPTTRRSDLTRCGARFGRAGHTCVNYAGYRTAHDGVGRCFRHDTARERAAGAWAVAHRISQIQDISPWDALLLAVKRAAAWAAFYDSKLAEVAEDDDLRPNGAAYAWVEASERANEKLARWSKMAVDAGVQAIMVQQAQAGGQVIAQVLNTALSLAGLEEDAEVRLRTALRQAITQMTAGALSDGTIDGEASELPAGGNVDA